MAAEAVEDSIYLLVSCIASQVPVGKMIASRSRDGTELPSGLMFARSLNRISIWLTSHLIVAPCVTWRSLQVDMGTHCEVLLFPSNWMDAGSTDIETRESSDPFSRASKLRKALTGNLILSSPPPTT